MPRLTEEQECSALTNALAETRVELSYFASVTHSSVSWVAYLTLFDSKLDACFSFAQYETHAYA